MTAKISVVVASITGGGLIASIANTSATGKTQIRLCSDGGAGTRGCQFKSVNGKACGVVGTGSNGILSISNKSATSKTTLRRCADGGAITRR